MMSIFSIEAIRDKFISNLMDVNEIATYLKELGIRVEVKLVEKNNNKKYIV